jgi:hypothetical protein
LLAPTRNGVVRAARAEIRGGFLATHPGTQQRIDALKKL